MSNRSTGESDDFRLTRSQIRELERSAADLKDPVRYLLVSRMARRFVLYYNVSEDVYAMNDPAGGTLFKRLKTARAVQRLLGSRIQIVPCSTRRRGRERFPVQSSIKFPRWTGRI